MNKSLQDQLLNAGLVDKKQAKQVSKQKRKQQNVARRQKDGAIDENKQAIEKAQKEKQAKDKQLNAKKQDEANKKALQAQVFQLIERYRLKSTEGDIDYHFKDGTLVKRITLQQAFVDEIVRGRLCIARHKTKSQDTTYVLIPKPIAERIEQRSHNFIIPITSDSSKNSIEKSQTEPPENSDEAYYAQFEIPDDLVW